MTNPTRQIGDGFFTLVFSGNISKLPGNPHRTETPFGRAVVAGVGDAFAELDQVRSDLSTITSQRDEALRLLRELLEIIGGVSMPDCPTMTRALASTARCRSFLATVEDKP